MSPCEIFRATRLDINLAAHDWAYARTSRTSIDHHWRDMTSTRPALYDGRVLLLHQQSVSGDAFAGACFETSFSAFVYWRKQGFPDLSVRNFFSMAVLRAEDGAFLLGEMGSQTASAGQVYCPAGTPDLGDVRDGKVDLLASVMRELAEETGLQPDDVAVQPGWDVVSCGGYLAFMRQMRVAGSGVEAAARIEATLALQAEPELARIHVIPALDATAGLAMPPFMRPYLAYAFQAG